MSECGDQVEVCVNLTRPQTDILDEVVYLDIVRNDTSKYIPPGSVLASKNHCELWLPIESLSVMSDWSPQSTLVWELLSEVPPQSGQRSTQCMVKQLSRYWMEMTVSSLVK